MPVLVIRIPPRVRLAARTAAQASGLADRVAAEFDYALSADGSATGRVGRAAPALLPRATQTVVVLADADVAWHRVSVPKAAPARMRAALAGLLEEALLEDEDTVHFALAPGAVPGQPGWVAVVHRPWLAATLAELARHGVQVDAVMPSSAPVTSSGAPVAASGHFFTDLPRSEGDVETDSVPTLALSHAGGVACLRLTGSLARAALSLLEPPDSVQWTATPAAAAAAEQWLGSPVAVCTEAERALQTAGAPWDLRQFDLAPRHRGTLALRDAARRFLSPDWRSVRWGLVALLALQVVGLNAWAWQQRQGIESRQRAMVELLQRTHPQVRAVLDAPLQMQRETERLRAVAGRPGDADLEVLLAAAAAAWPEGQGPVQTLRFETGRLTLAAPGWQDAQLRQFRERLQPAGFAAEMAEGRIVLTRAAPPPRGRA